MNTLRHSPRGAFSLPEMMMAIVLFGVGFALTMAVFPIGMKNHKDAERINVGSTLCDAAFYKAMSKLRPRLVNPNDCEHPKHPFQDPDDGLLDLPEGEDNHMPFYYPHEENISGSPQRGCFLVGRPLSDYPQQSIYLMAAVSYEKIRNHAGFVELAEVDDLSLAKDTNADGDTYYRLTADAGELAKILIRSPLIHRKTGKYAFMDTVARYPDRVDVMFDRSWEDMWEEDQMPTGGDRYYVLKYEDNNIIVSPALTVKVTRTVLPMH